MFLLFIDFQLGLPSILAGIATWFLLPDCPNSCTFLTNEEKELLRNHLESSEKYISDMNFVEASNVRQGSEIIEIKEIQPEVEENVNDHLDNSECLDADRKATKFIYWKTIKTTIMKPTILLMAFLFFCSLTVSYSISFFLPAFLSSLGLTDIDSNLLTVPIYLSATIITLIISRWSGNF